MPTPTAEPPRGVPLSRAERTRLLARRGWYWAADYRYIARAQGRGLVSREVPDAYSRGDRPPVVLIAGVLEPWTLLRPIADRLNAAGHPVQVIPELAYNVITVAEASELAAGMLAARRLRDVILVAHSKGGLVGKHMLAADSEGRIRHLIAVATPFAGSTLAWLVPSPTIQALRPEDPTIVELTAQPELNARITSIYPSFDPHIPGGSYLEGATNVPVQAIGHFRILRDPEVLDAVVAAAER